MSRFFPPDWLEELRQKADIVTVIGSYTQLKRRGKSYVGLCPFHHEKTPSFTVSEDKQLYHCFGCKASGSVFNFIMDIENLDFDGAVKFLASSTNMPLPEEIDSPDYIMQKGKRDKIAEINRKVAIIYHNLLWKEEGKFVLEYFKSRGLNDSDIIRFGLGASSFDDIILDTLTKDGYSPEDLVDAWVVAKKNGKYYDIFKNRAMFPIVGRRGVVLGFGARALGKNEPKYINTHDTKLFNKREHLYGANLLGSWKKEKAIYLVEGYMDVIALNKYGIDGAVATLGTSLTSEQANIISRTSNNIIICYDGDEPGQKAIERAVDIFLEIDKSVEVLCIPNKKDPDEYLKEYGKEEFLGIKLISGMMFKVNRLASKYDLSNAQEKAEFGKEATKLISKLPSAIDRDSLIAQTSLKYGFRYEVLDEEVSILLNQNSDSNDTYERFAAKVNVDKSDKNEQKNHTESEKTLLAFLISKKVAIDAQYKDFFDNPIFKDTFEKLLNGVLPVQIIEQIDDKNDRNLVAEAVELSKSLEFLDEAEAAKGIIETLKKRKIERLTAELEEQQKAISFAVENEKISILSRCEEIKTEINKLLTGK